MRGVLFLIGRRNGAAVRVMQTKLRERDFVENGCLGGLASQYRQQQRLHDQCIDRKHPDQRSPERSPLQTCLIWSGLHTDKYMLLYRVRDRVRFPISTVGGSGVATPAEPSLWRTHAKRKLADNGISHENDRRRALRSCVYGSPHRGTRSRRRGQGGQSRHHAGLEPRHAEGRQDRRRLSHHREQGDDGRQADRRAAASSPTRSKCTRCR